MEPGAFVGAGAGFGCCAGPRVFLSLEVDGFGRRSKLSSVAGWGKDIRAVASGGNRPVGLGASVYELGGIECCLWPLVFLSLTSRGLGCKDRSAVTAGWRGRVKAIAEGRAGGMGLRAFVVSGAGFGCCAGPCVFLSVALGRF